MMRYNSTGTACTLLIASIIVATVTITSTTTLCCHAFVVSSGISKTTTTLAFAPNHLVTYNNVPAFRNSYNRNARKSNDYLAVVVLEAIKSKEQEFHTAERISGMSRGEIAHIFTEVDTDGSGTLDFAEIDMLAKYFGQSRWDLDTKKKMFKEIDDDGNGEIDADEFYKWMVLNNTAVTTEDGSKSLAMRQERLDVGKNEVPQHLLDLLEELNVGAVVQQVTHPLHSAFGRTLYDHFVSCYVLSKQWGNSEEVNDAAILHAVYQRGDGMRAVDFNEYRPYLQEKMGKDVEEYVYLFPSAHKSALLYDGLLHAPVGGDIQVPNVLEGGLVTIPEDLRAGLVELEVINSHDQNVLENTDPVQNLWSFYTHATVMPLLSNSAKDTVIEFRKRALGATCQDIIDWHRGRFADAEQEVPAVWEKHLEMFEEGGKYFCAEKALLKFGDKDGDGSIDYDEFNNFDWDQCFID